MNDSIERWLEAQRYLPEFMRDFHDQKDLFKMLDEVRIQNKEKNGGNYLDGVDWISANIYTVDIFLWVMARHGYTLQKSRKKFDFNNIYATVSDHTKKLRRQMVSIIFGSK